RRRRRCASRRPVAARRPARRPPRRAPARAARSGGRLRGGHPRPPRRPAARDAAETRAAPATLPRGSSSSAGGLCRTDLHLDALANDVRDLEGAEAVPPGDGGRLPRPHGLDESVDLLAQGIALADLEVLQGERRVAVAVRLAPADPDPPLVEVEGEVGVGLEDAEFALPLERDAARRHVRDAAV